MLRLKMLLCVLLLFGMSLIAQTAIKGKVYDAETGEILIGANIALDNMDAGTVTNEKGYYEFAKLEDGKYVMTASYIGYEPQRVIVYVTSGLAKEVNFDLYKKIYETDQIVVTATKGEQTIGNVIGRVELINERNLRATPSQSVDDLFKTVSGVNVDRNSGMFGQANVNIRGVTSGEQGRILALVDGQPINKSDGGTVNWNRVLLQDVERVEIFKGPGSSVYGNNAMGGVVNFLTKKQTKEGYNATAGVSYGNFNTFEQNVSVSGKTGSKSGLNFRVSGFNRTSDGYNTYIESVRDRYYVNSSLKETGVTAKLGYELNQSTNVSVNYNFYDDNRGSGTNVKEDNYQKHKTNYAALALNSELFGVKININAFAQFEKYKKVMEKYKIDSKDASKLSSYDLIYVDADRDDLGASINLTFTKGINNFTAGFEYKIGTIDGADIYQTSTDRLVNTGDMNTISAFLQDEIVFDENLKIFAGLRLDMVKFTNGKYDVLNPTKASMDFVQFAGKLKDYDWNAITPKLSIQYKFNNNFSTYAAYSQGFRAATLDDMTRSGFIKLGLKLANPELKPETIDNFELGFNYDYDKKLFIMPSFYYMQGKDFMYYIWTGKPDVNKKKVIKKDNITKVDFYGADVDVKYFVNSNLYLFGNVSYTHTEIKGFTGNEGLVGKKLTYTPEYTANLGASFLNEYVNVSLSAHYQGKQFTTDDNIEIDKYGASTLIKEYVTVDMKLWQKLYRMVTLSLDIQNIFDKKELTTYDRYAPGIIISGGLTVEL